MKNNTVSIGKNILAARKAKNMTREDLAAEVGIEVKTLYRIEMKDAQPKPNNLQKIANALSVSVEDLLPPDCESNEDNVDAAVEKYTNLIIAGIRPIIRSIVAMILANNNSR